MKKTLLILSLTCFQVLFAQETFKTMFYNVLNYPDLAPASRINDLAIVLNDYQPDIFMVCELNNETGANTILSTIQNVNANFQRATFQLNTSDDTIGDSNDLQNMIYYDSTKFSLESLTNSDGSVLDQYIVTSLFRDFNHYRLKLNTTQQATNPVFLNVIVCHLKASSGGENEQLRLAMVEDLQNYLDTIPSTEYVMLAGDLNLYTSSEPAFQELIGISNNIIFTDPANRIGSWHNNDNFVDVMTQSTRLAGSGLGGSTGGFDDRFDFILTSESMQSSAELSFVNDSYNVYGNNELQSCYNQDIISALCGNNDATDEFSQNIRTALYNFSDHLPVTLELQTNQTLGTPEFAAQEASIQIIGGNVVNQTITIKANNHSLNINQLKIYNVLGQTVKTLMFGNSSYITEDVSNLSQGIYYIAARNTNTEPLKFIKVD